VTGLQRLLTLPTGGSTHAVRPDDRHWHENRCRSCSSRTTKKVNLDTSGTAEAMLRINMAIKQARQC